MTGKLEEGRVDCENVNRQKAAASSKSQRKQVTQTAVNTSKQVRRTVEEEETHPCRTHKELRSFSNEPARVRHTG